MLPTLAVVVPTANALDPLGDTLDSLQASEMPWSETLIVQNGDEVGESLTHSQTLADRYSISNLRVIHETVPGLLAGRHRGVAESSAEILVFLDDDVAVSAQWSKAIAECFCDPQVHLVGGPATADYRANCPSWLERFFYHEGSRSWCSYLSLLDFGDQRMEIDPNLIWGLNFAIRRSTLLQLGGFHPDGVPWKLRRFRGDGETAVSKAVQRAGLKAIYDPDVAIKHKIPANRLTPSYFCKRAYLQGITDSFTDLRRQHLNSTSVRSPSPISFRERASTLIKQMIKTAGADRDRIVFQTKTAHRRGYRYHQAQFRRDPAVRRWVLRPNYWDYTYPS